jgi:carboxymethylenebutenolidase
VELVETWTTIPGPAASVPAYMVRPAPAAEPLPAVLVIQEMWGLDRHIRDVARRLATAGYLVLAPDLYAHAGARPPELSEGRILQARGFLDAHPGSVADPAAREAALERLPEPQRAEVAATLELLWRGVGNRSGPRPQGGMEDWLEDLVAAADWLRGRPECRGRRVGSVGFCMGGTLSGLLACTDGGLGAAVVFYGSAPPAERVAAIRCPVLGLYGAEDRRITDQVPAFAAAMRAAGKAFTYRVYPAPHAFFNDERPSYRVEAARHAWAETLAFLACHLSPPA